MFRPTSDAVVFFAFFLILALAAALSVAATLGAVAFALECTLIR